MADTADIAAQNDFTEEVLRRHSTRVEVPLRRGKCLNCEEPLANNALYCSLGCREDYEQEQRIKASTRR